jgi:hypothetical protein
MSRNFGDWAHTLEDRIAAAKSRFDDNQGSVTPDDRSALSRFEQRYAELRDVASAADGEAELGSPASAHTSLLDELQSWVADLDRRYGKPARRIPNVSM